MRLYHFRNTENGLRSIKEKRLKISRITELNDPFELLGVDMSDKNERKRFKTMKENLSKTNGLLCFSKNWQNPVQWAHYADNHKGICMGFDVPDDLMIKIDYLKERLPYPDKYDEKFILKVLSSKFDHWDYEEEFRVYISLDKNEEEHGLYFSKFSDQLKLKRIIVGCESDISRREIEELIDMFDYKIEYFKARPGYKKFEIVRNQNDKLWT
jgi:hypothetical protein